MKICIFGGSFDPFHLGHFEILKRLNSENFDLILLMPAFLSPFKNSSLFTAQERLQMCEIVAAQFEKVQVCDFEIQQNRAVYTIESLEFLQAKFAQSRPQFTLALGLDSFLSLHKWKNYEQILTMCHFIVFDRNCAHATLDFKGLRDFKSSPDFQNLQNFQNLNSENCTFLPLQNPLSSTFIKANLRIQNLRDFLPDALLENVEQILKTRSDFANV